VKGRDSKATDGLFLKDYFRLWTLSPESPLPFSFSSLRPCAFAPLRSLLLLFFFFSTSSPLLRICPGRLSPIHRSTVALGHFALE